MKIANIITIFWGYQKNLENFEKSHELMYNSLEKTTTDLTEVEILLVGVGMELPIYSQKLY